MITIGSLFTVMITVILTIPYTSFMEWTLHRFIMHRPFKIRLPWRTYVFEYPFQAHAVTHHGIFQADKTYHLEKDEDKFTIPMAWWNGPVLTVIGTLPFMIASVVLGSWVICITAGCVIFAYYGTYEYIHWCMHLPRERNIERTGVFFRLNGHHLLHHRYMNKNFNVVLPLTDWALGTLVRRSPVRFAQVTGPSVPNVQPID